MTAQRGDGTRPVSAEPTAADYDAATAVVIEWSSGDLSPTRQRNLTAAAIAAAREEGQQEGERIRAAVEAVISRAKSDGRADGYWIRCLRAAVTPAQPADGCRTCGAPDHPSGCAQDFLRWRADVAAQPVTRTTPEEPTDA